MTQEAIQSPPKPTSLLDDLVKRLTAMPEATRDAIIQEATQATKGYLWIPTPGPQTDAYFCEADELFYGGSAGGGKSDLGVGLSLTAHERSLILRRFRDDARDLSDRIETIMGTDKGRNSALLSWDIGARVIQLGGCKDEKDKQRYKGRARDLMVFDEVSDFLRSQYEFIIGWNRSTTPGQRCRVVATGNPPTTAEGLWVIERWAAWLDPKHPNPAKQGELRWYTTDKTGKEIEVQGAGPHIITHEDGSTERLLARSRTFIRANLNDNPYLMNTTYGASLDALPIEMRHAYRDGAFEMSLRDNARQVIPTAWIIEAQKRWTPKPPDRVPMCAIGVDVAQGGKDETVMAPRYDGWYAPLVRTPGEKTPDGKSVVAILITVRKNSALPIIDMGGGYGGATKELLEDNQIKTIGYKGAAESYSSSKCKNFGFKNKRSESYWKFREALDPDQPGGSPIALPPDPKLVSDLTAVTFTVKRGKGGRLEIVLENKEDVTSKLGRSPDGGDAVVQAWTDGAKADSHANMWQQSTAAPVVNMGHRPQRRR